MIINIKLARFIKKINISLSYLDYEIAKILTIRLLSGNNL